MIWSLERILFWLIRNFNTFLPAFFFESFQSSILEYFSKNKNINSKDLEFCPTHKFSNTQNPNNVEFGEGDMVMVRMKLEWLPTGTYKKLHPSSEGPFKILKKIKLQCLCALSSVRHEYHFHIQCWRSHNLSWALSRWIIWRTRYQASHDSTSMRRNCRCLWWSTGINKERRLSKVLSQVERKTILWGYMDHRHKLSETQSRFLWEMPADFLQAGESWCKLDYWALPTGLCLKAQV